MSTERKFASQKRFALPGSERKPFDHEGSIGTLAATQETSAAHVSVTVVVRRRQPLDDELLASRQRRPMSREEFATQYGPDPGSVDLIHQFAREFGLTVEPVAADGRATVHLSGSMDKMQRAFGVTLQPHTAGGATRLREGAIYLPEDLSGHVLAVLGLDDRPQAKAHFRVAKPHATNVSYTPVQVAELYGFPSGTKASGQTLGLIELGGGYREADLTAYFATLNLPAPTVTAVSVDSGKNTPGDANGADGEVMLDIEVCAAVASGAKVVVYFAPNTDQGFHDAIVAAVHDTANSPGVISISWGGPESSWTAQAMTAMDSACQAAAALGVTICVACGDNGSSDGVSGTANHVDFPASSPHVLACGGTKLSGSGSTIQSETVWNEQASGEGATGGGVSDVFALPSWQANSGVPKPTVSGGGRGVPDVSGDADPSTGYVIRVDGETTVIGGTSAVAPLWAGLVALANAANGSKAGFVNPTLYASGAASAFRDITQGNNGSFSANSGWDACSGLGSPVGSKVIAALAG